MNGHATQYGDMPMREPEHPIGWSALKRISWGAVFAGTLVALVAQLLFSLLGLGIGLGTIDPVEESNPLEGLGTGSIIWWSVTMLISLFLGGWVAGRLAGIPKAFDSILHGALAFCLFTLLTFYLLTTTVGSIISGVGSVIGKTVSLAGQGLSSVAPEVGDALQSEAKQQNIDLSSIKQEARLLLQQTGKEELQPGNLEQDAKEFGNTAEERASDAAQDPQSAGQSTDNLIDELFAQGKDITKEIDKEAVTNVIMERTGKSRQEADQIATNWIQTFEQGKAEVKETVEQAKQDAEVMAEKTAEAMSKAGIYAFLGLLLGAGAAGFGGKVGEPHDVVETVNA